MVKIGFSADPSKRLSELQCASATPLVLRAVSEGDRETERTLHLRFDRERERGEWFRLSGYLQEHVESLPAVPPKKPRHGVQHKVLAQTLGCCESQVSHFFSGKRNPSVRQAVKIFELTSHKVGPIAQLTDEEVAALAAMGARLAA